MDTRNQKVKKKRKYKKFRDMTKSQQLKLVRRLSIVGIVFVTLIAITATIIFKSIAGSRAESDTEGDIFSRGFDKDGESSIIIDEADVPKAVQSAIDQDAAAEPDMTPIYEGMKRDNPDFVGYLKIEGTNIEYPVMYSPEEPEKYLDKDFRLEKSVSGLPFIDARCKLDPVSDNLIIYGHNMKDGSMFGLLDSYRDKDYCKDHPVIRYDTLDGSESYQVVYAFYDRIYYDDETDFRFYDFIDADGKNDFAETMSILAAKSIYNMDIPTEYGDKFITLVTCAYQEDEGRFVVVAKKI